MRHESARGAAVRNRNSVARDAFVPFAHAHRDHLVAFPSRWHKVPFVVFARSNALGIACVQLRYGEPLPGAKRDFGKLWLSLVAVWSQAQGAPHQFHCFASSSERT